MANFTKRALMESFLELIQEKPINKISVKDITNHCGVNRNTFYYHFQDIPALIEDIVSEDTEQIIMENPKIESIEQCIDVAMSLILKRKNMVYHIYHSTERAIFEQYLWHTCENVITSYYDIAFSDVPVSQFDRSVIIDYYKGLCFGLSMMALEHGLEEDMRPFIHRVCELKQSFVEEMIENCRIGNAE